MADEKKVVSVKVFRFDPEVDKEPHYDTFPVETEIGFSIYNALEYIYDNLDSSLAFYASCRIGQCHGCLTKANGKIVHSCTEMLTEDVVLEPISKDNVLRDLTTKVNPIKEN